MFEPFERYRPLIDDWEAFTEALARPLPVCVWTNTLRTTPEALAETLRAEGCAFEPLAWHPGAFRLTDGAAAAHLPSYLAGLFHIQEEVSMLPAMLLAPRPGERVLDLCAAPGNKTAEIAVAMRGAGTVVANDLSRGRLHVLRTTVDRLGLLNVSVTRHDAAAFPDASGGFDRVLLDAPCSCEGTARKHPRVVAQSSRVNSLRMGRMQTRMLARAVDRCRPGGRIVYATCTFAPEENERVVAETLQAFGDAVRLLPARIRGLRTTPGLTTWEGESFPDDLRLTSRLWPHHNDTGGFFVAVFEKSPGAEAPSPASPAALPEPIDPGDVLPPLEARFGFPRSAFEDCVFFRPNDKYVSVVARDHRPPAKPLPEMTGMYFLKTALRHPKPTTQATMHFGHAATRNVVTLDAEKLGAYLDRREVRLTATEAARCEGFGYVLVRHRGHTYGVGLFRPEGAGGRVESLFPKTWAGVHRKPGTAIRGGNGT
ncbi:RsmB/NOP family class I SAM-dependent RNA methyltransferase [Rhodocaloribacter sp.]